MVSEDDVRAGEVVWVDLTSTDPDRSAEFYRELFGWRVADASPATGGYRLATRSGEPIAGLVASDPSASLDGWLPYLRVDALDAAFATAVEAGATAPGGPIALGRHGAFAVLADPTGAPIGLLRPGTFAGFGDALVAGAPVWFELHSSDADRAAAFYAATFGLDAVPATGSREVGYTTLRDDDGMVAFSVLDASADRAAGRRSTWVVAFGSTDVELDARRACDLGATCPFGPAEVAYGRIATIVDPVGTVFALVQLGD